MLERAPSLHLVLSSLLFSKLEEQEIRKKDKPNGLNTPRSEV